MNFSYPFNGLGVALITPFDRNGQVDWQSLSKLVEYQISNGVDFLCILGTTAETPTLGKEERLQILKYVISQNAGRVPILAGCSSNCTQTAVEQIRQYQFDGIDGILSCVPYYNKPSQEGIYCHFRELAKASTKPIVLYNVPGRTGANMSASTCIRLAKEFKNIIGIKEASGNMDQVRQIIEQAPDGFKLVIGDDSLTLQAIQAGAAGVISVIGNALPQTFGKLVHHCMNGEFQQAGLIDGQLSGLYGLLFKEGNPCGVKDLMASRGLIDNVLRLPLVPVSTELHNQIVQGFKDIEK